MRILGVGLTTPVCSDLVPVGVIGLIVTVTAVVLVATGTVGLNNGVAIATGAIGGSLANAYGVSIQNNGWRGGVLSMLFGVSLMFMVRLLMAGMG